MHVKLFRFPRVMQEGAVLKLDSDLDTNGYLESCSYFSSQGF